MMERRMVVAVKLGLPKPGIPLAVIEGAIRRQWHGKKIPGTTTSWSFTLLGESIPCDVSIIDAQDDEEYYCLDRVHTDYEIILFSARRFKDKVNTTLCQSVLLPYVNTAQKYIANNASIVLSGVRGGGKTSAAEMLYVALEDSSYNVEFVTGDELATSATEFSTADAYLSDLVSNNPTILIVDNLQYIDPPSEENVVSMSPLLSSLVSRMENNNLTVVATVTNPSYLPPSIINRSGRFEKIISLSVPDEKERLALLKFWISQLNILKSSCDEIALYLAERTGGYVAQDLKRIVRRAAATRGQKGLQQFEEALSFVSPSQLQDLNVERPSLHQDSLRFGGYDSIRKRLIKIIEWKFSVKPNHLGVDSYSGVLLTGPTGTGKSFLARTIAADLNVNFVSIKSSELVSKYLGETEATIRSIFARARVAGPCILFFDELDSITRKRDNDEGGGGGLESRVLSTLLNELDGVDGGGKESMGKNSSIFIIAATNRQESLDSALVRPGRIDQIFEIGLPVLEDRVAILQTISAGMPLDDDVQLKELALKTEGLTASDLAKVIREGAMKAIRSDFHIEFVSHRHFLDAISDRIESLTAIKDFKA